MKSELWELNRIVPYDGSPRKNDQAVEPVAKSIEEFGFLSPIIVDKDGKVIAGHTRLKAALKLGKKEVPVLIADHLTPEQVKAFRIADNATAAIAEWDFELLPLELAALDEMDFDLGLLAFSSDELANIIGDEASAGLTDPDEIPEPPPEPVTQPGDLWVLGDHRLLCGNSTNPSHVRKLMNGELARMMFTDPPWNVAIGKDSNPRHRQRKGLANDDLSPTEFREFLDKFIEVYSPDIEGDVYCVLGASEWPTLDSTLRGRGYHWSATIIWAKDTFEQVSPALRADLVRLAFHK